MDNFFNIIYENESVHHQSPLSELKIWEFS